MTKPPRPTIEYDPSKPACLLHGYGHWTKDCKEINPPKKGQIMPDADEIRKLLNKFFSIEDSGYGVEQLNEAVEAILSYCQEREREATESLTKAKDNAYWERDQLVSALSRIYPAWLGYHTGEDWEDDWRTIVYIGLPSGQVSWHIHDSEKKYFTHLDPGIEEWDGHTTEEKYKRLEQLSKQEKEK